MIGIEVTYGADVREKLIKGIDLLANTVKITLGPKGKNVIYDYWPDPVITKDGVTVADRFFLKDRLEHMGARIARAATRRTRDDVGDGTTTSTILMQAILKEGHKALISGMNPMAIKNGIDLAVEKVIEHLHENSIKITTPEELLHVATVSANHDIEIGKIIAETFEKVGVDGVISLEKGTRLKTELFYTDGFIVDSGLMSQDFINSQRSSQCVLEDTLVYVSDGEYRSKEIITDIIGQAYLKKQPLVIFGSVLYGDAYNHIIHNIRTNDFRCCFVPLPENEMFKRNIMKDIALLTGAKVILTKEGMRQTKPLLQSGVYGFAKKIMVTKDKTIIQGGEGKEADVTKHCDNLKSELKRMEDTSSDPDIIMHFKKRIANFNNGIASIIVGGQTAIEISERYDRVEDSTFATRAALEEGILPGGGTSLLKSIDYLNKIKHEDPDVETGFRIIKHAIQSPVAQIAYNAEVNGETVVDTVMKNKDYNYGYDASKNAYCDMIEAGVIDPTKVIRCALQNAASVSGLLLATGAAICAVEEESAPVINRM